MPNQQLGQLTNIERRTLIALNSERQRLIGEIQELDQALKAQVTGIAERLKLPPDDYDVEQGKDGTLHLVRPAPAPEAQPEN